MTLSKHERIFMDKILEKGDMSIKELSLETGYSGSFVRTQLDMMVAKKELRVDKRRQPYVYEVSEESPELNMRKAVEHAKTELRDSKESTNRIVKAVKSYPKKETWINAVVTLKSLAQAIEEMDADGELIDTL